MAGVAVVQRTERRRTDRPDPGPGVGGPGATGHRGGPGAGDAARAGRGRDDRRATPRGGLGAPAGDAGDAGRRRHRRRGRTAPSISSPDGSLIAVDRLDATGLRAHRSRDGEVVEEVTTEHQPGDGALSFAPSGDDLGGRLSGAVGRGQAAIPRARRRSGRRSGSRCPADVWWDRSPGLPGAYHVPVHDSDWTLAGGDSRRSRRGLGGRRLGRRRRRDAEVARSRNRLPFLPGTDSVARPRTRRYRAHRRRRSRRATSIREIETPDDVTTPRSTSTPTVSWSRWSRPSPAAGSTSST